MIEVFSTNVHESPQADKLVGLLRQQFPNSRINFDLDDRDKILRVEGADFHPVEVISLVTEQGFDCKILE
jgi:hypothetical protein